MFYGEKTNRGFVMLFAVLLSSILLAIGLGIFSITYKELLLSSSDRESQVAFYAADSGGECALYWDAIHPGYGTSIFGFVGDGVNTPAVSGTGSPLCAGIDINDVWETTDPGVTPIVTVFDVTFENGLCAHVTVTKDYDTETSQSTTVINSRGFNTCREGDSRRAERGLRISY